MTVSVNNAVYFAVTSDGCTGIVLGPDATCTFAVMFLPSPDPPGTSVVATATVAAFPGGSFAVTLLGQVP